MTRDEFDKMLEANQIVFVGEAAWRVAQLVAAAEREACAKEAENENNFDSTECGTDVTNDIAKAIRARGKK